MTTEARKPKRLRRILIWLGVVAFILFIGVPTALVLRTRLQISSALRSASIVRLEEYLSGETLTSRTLTAAEFHQVTAALPVTGDFGVPGLIALCFIPHHRVVIVGPGHIETTFAVCFSCEQIAVSDSGILSTPYAWRRPLRQLFLRHDIPIRDRYIRGLDVESQ